MSLKIKTGFKKNPYGFSRFFPKVDTTEVEGIPEIVNTINYTNSFTVSGDVITYKLILDTHVCYHLVIDYNLIKQHASFADQTLWSISDSCFNKHLEREDKTQSYTVTEEDLVNVYIETSVTKPAWISVPYIDGNSLPIKIFVPSKNSTINDIFILVPEDQTEDHVDVTFTNTGGNVSELNLENLAYGILSPITITPSKSTITEDDKVTLTVTTEDTSITEVYAEPVFGMVSKTRIPLTNGVGTVNVMSFGLSTGDSIRIKFGHKFFTGLSEYTNIVT